MKKLPDAELELRMIIWEAKEPISRMEIEERLDGAKEVVASTLLTLLSRLEKRGFVGREKRGKVNYYTALVPQEQYLKAEGHSILQKMFRGSLSNFVTALYTGEKLSKQDLEELKNFLDEQMKNES